MPNIGRIDFLVGLDGTGLPNDARAQGELAGAEFGQGMEDEALPHFSQMGRDLVDQMSEDGDLAGLSFGDSMERSVKGKLASISNDLANAFVDNKGLASFAESLGGVDEAVDKLTEHMNALRAAGLIEEGEIDDLTETMHGWRDATIEAIAAQDALKKELQDGLEQETLRTSEAMNALKIEIADAMAESEASVTTATNAIKIELSDMADAAEVDWLRASIAAKGGVDSMDISIDDLRVHLKELEADEIKAAAANEAYNKSLADAGRALDDNSKKTDKNTGSQRSLYQSLSANTRQWIAISTFIAAAGQDIAVLGDAATSSLLEVGGVATAIGTAAAVGIVAIKGILSTTLKLPAALDPARKAAQNLETQFKGLQTVLTVSVFQNLAGPINDLTTKFLPALSSGLTTIGGAVGDVFGQIAEALTTTGAISGFKTLLTGFAPIIKSIGSAAISLGQAFGTIFIAALPGAITLAADIAGIAKKFSDFINSVQGKNALATFFSDGSKIASAVIPFLVAAAKAVAGLVTPAAIKSVQDFFGALTDFLPTLSGILQVLGKLNLFGLIADALKDIGSAIKPILPDLKTFAGAFSGSLATAMKDVIPLMKTLFGLIGDLLPALTPLLPPLVTFVKVLSDGLVTVLKPLVPLIVSLVKDGIGELVKILPIVTPLLKPLAKTFNDIITQVAPLIPLLIELALPFVNQLVPILKVLVPILTLVITAFGLLFKIIGDLLDPLLEAATHTNNFKDGVKEANKELSPFVGWLNKVATGFENWVEKGKGVQDWVTQTMGMFTDFVTNTTGMFSDFFTNTVGMFQDFGTNATLALAQFTSNTAGMFTDFVTNTTGMFVDFFTNTIGMFHDFAVNAAGFIGGLVGQIVQFFAALPGQIAVFVGGIGNQIGLFFAPAVALVAGIVQTVVGFFSGIVGRITAFMGGVGVRIGSFFAGLVSTVKGYVDDVVDFFRDLPGRILKWIGGLGAEIGRALSFSASGSVNTSSMPPHATGGIFTHATAGVFGEAGPEALVPLDRPLSQVDPAVRALSAFAQGLSGAPGVAAGAYVAPGAITVVSQYSNPQLVVSEMLDAIVSALGR